ncbi:Hypothetical predicted protein [Cloeon dipterum]|uniref:Uncharacterized protein n=1 Tax=Cloeon dipterum TaxID=197152 RepID=A0A8S1DPG5_9INSE|nr:Hypothetical predicted protein [Cloeon dipterum]
MSRPFWPYWILYNKAAVDVPLDKLVPCSPNNPIPSYVVGVFNQLTTHPQPGYAYYNGRSFSCGYFIVETQKVLVSDHYYFLAGGNVSFRPNKQVPEDQWFKVGTTKDNKPVYIGTVYTGTEEICGPVIDGVCNAAFKGLLRYPESENYKVLALNAE